MLLPYLIVKVHVAGDMRGFFSQVSCPWVYWTTFANPYSRGKRTDSPQELRTSVKFCFSNWQCAGLLFRSFFCFLDVILSNSSLCQCDLFLFASYTMQLPLPYLKVGYLTAPPANNAIAPHKDWERSRFILNHEGLQQVIRTMFILFFLLHACPWHNLFAVSSYWCLFYLLSSRCLIVPLFLNIWCLGQAK